MNPAFRANPAPQEWKYPKCARNVFGLGLGSAKRSSLDTNVADTKEDIWVWSLRLAAYDRVALGGTRFPGARKCRSGVTASGARAW